MNAEEAQKRLAAFLNHLAGDVAYSPPADWSATGFQLVALANGDWIALPPTAPEQGIVLRDDGGDAPFYGALGKMVPALGLPRSREMLLGSTELGRYQTYERGLAIWETVTIDGNTSRRRISGRYMAVHRKARADLSCASRVL
jgi:hypothetical protein